MRRSTILLGAILAVAAFLWAHFRTSSVSEAARPDTSSSGERTPVCPWREPRRDLLALFAPSTNYIAETRSLSGMMVPIRKRLGRSMTVDENPLRIFRVSHDGHRLGSTLLCRVKGEHGGIEIVTGVDTNGTVRGVRIQSQREPGPVAQVITSSNFLASFLGKNSSSALRIGEDLPDAAPEARSSAQAIADGVRSQLIVLSFAEASPESRGSGIHTNH